MFFFYCFYLVRFCGCSLLPPENSDEALKKPISLVCVSIVSVANGVRSGVDLSQHRDRNRKLKAEGSRSGTCNTSRGRYRAEPLGGFACRKILR